MHLGRSGQRCCICLRPVRPRGCSRGLISGGRSPLRRDLRISSAGLVKMWQGMLHRQTVVRTTSWTLFCPFSRVRRRIWFRNHSRQSRMSWSKNKRGLVHTWGPVSRIGSQYSPLYLYLLYIQIWMFHHLQWLNSDPVICAFSIYILYRSFSKLIPEHRFGTDNLKLSN